MKRNYIKLSKVVLAASTLILLGSCGADADSAGLEYMPDMYRSPAIEPYVDYGEIKNVENPEFKMIRSAKVPPSGTVPYYGTNEADVAIMMPYKRLPNYGMDKSHGHYGMELAAEGDDQYALAANDKNELAITKDNAESIMAEGKHLFTTKCAHCHGKKGDGNGSMVESGAYVGAADLTALSNLSDGQMFYSIYYGKGMMGAHNSILNKKQIWTLVHYIRKFQNADYPSFEAPTETVDTPVENGDNH